MSTIIRLLKLTLPYRKWIALSVVLGVLTIGTGIGLMMASAFIISMAALHPSIAELQVAIVGVRFFGISRGVFRYLERLVSHDTTFRLLNHFRVRFYQALEPLVPARLGRLKSADLLQRIVADIQNLENFFVRVMAPPAVAFLSGLLMFALLCSFGLEFALIFLVFYLLAGTIIPYLSIQLSQGLGKKITLLKSELNVVLLDQLNGLSELVINRQTVAQQQKIRDLNQQLTTLQKRMLSIEALHQGFVTLLLFGAVTITLILGIQKIEAGSFNGIYLAVLVLGIMAAFEGVLPLPPMAQYLEENKAAGQRLFEIIDQPPVLADPSVPQTFPTDSQIKIDIKDLSFYYAPTEQAVLQNLAMEIKPSAKVAIVGPSGSGKSTLARLLIRLYDYQQGHIRLNDIELRSFKQNDVRENIAYAAQAFHLFTGSVLENLHLIKPDAQEDQIMEILNVVKLDELASTPAEVLSYQIGEHGQRLSGGQAQRLALAQVLVKNSPILIMDEVTANLDVETESTILKNIYKHFTNRTVINITHRLSNMEYYDKIFVLKDGLLIGAATHQELLESNPFYKHIFSVYQESLLLG